MHIYYKKPFSHEWRVDKILSDDIIDTIKKYIVLNIDCNNTVGGNMENIIYDMKYKSKLFYEMLTYCLYHDCGKPYCRTIDKNDNTHFPNHELVSYKKWTESDDSKFIGELILYDMMLHRSTIKELDIMFNNISHVQWCILILSALSEVHSNAVMFGGIESLSFKIKLKKILKNVKHIIKKIKSNK